MVAYVERESELEIMEFLSVPSRYKRIITIYPNDNKIICWYEY